MPKPSRTRHLPAALAVGLWQAATPQPDPAWQNEVVYQIYPRSFADANGDGIGDLPGITSKVDYLQKLGVDIVWLCPVNRSTNFDNGYDISDYLDIDPTFGTLKDWEDLRDALHQRKMKIMMDLVLNHTSDAHPWFQQEVQLKALERDLRALQGQFATSPTALAALRAALEGRPGSEPPAGVAAALAALQERLVGFRAGSSAARRLGYPSAQHQLERLAKLVFGTPTEQHAVGDNEAFYIWRVRPNNWTAIFSGSAWHRVEATGQYYLALFSLHQPDLNWSNPALRRAMLDMVRTWVKRGVDAFRLDSICFLGKHPDFPDAPTTDHALMGRGMQYYVNQPQVHDYLKDLKRVLPATHRTVGEVSFSGIATALEYAGFERHELTEVFLFDHVYVDMEKDNKWHALPVNLRELKRIISTQQTSIHNRAWLGNYLENHDQLRAVSRFGDDTHYRVESAKMLAVLLLTLEGTPYIYQGQEIGMTNTHFDRIEDIDDIEARNYYEAAIHMGATPDVVGAQVRARNRDHVRTVMQWDDGPFAGFSSKKPWIQVNPNYRTINVAADASSVNSTLAFYRSLITMRKQNSVFVRGAFRDLLPEDAHVFAYQRELRGQKIVVLLNFSGADQPLDIDLGGLLGPGVNLAISNYNVATPITPHLALRPYEARVYRDFIGP